MSSSSSSKSLMWMTIGLFTGMGVMLVGSFFTAKRVLSSMSVGAMLGSRNNMAMPHGKLRLERPNQAGPGLPVYPSSSLEMPDNSAVSDEIRDAQTGVEISKYHSTDARATIDFWYRDHLGPEFVRHEAGEQPRPDIFRESHVADTDIAFVAQRRGQTRIIALSMDENGTTISLVRMGQADANDNSAPGTSGSGVDSTPTTPATSQNGSGGEPAPTQASAPAAPNN